VSSRGIAAFRFTGWILRILSASLGIIAVVYLIDDIPALGSLGGSPSGAFSLIQDLAFIIIGAVIVAGLSGYMFKLANEQDESINERLLGFVVATNSATFDELAGWTRIRIRETADRLARLASQGNLMDFGIDLSNRMIMRTRGGTDTAGAGQPSIHAPQAAQTNAEADEGIRLKAKLYELDVLRQQGKIGQPAYDKLKEEYEKKLAQSDKGTQVY